MLCRCLLCEAPILCDDQVGFPSLFLELCSNVQRLILAKGAKLVGKDERKHEAIV